VAASASGSLRIRWRNRRWIVIRWWFRHFGFALCKLAGLFLSAFGQFLKLFAQAIQPAGDFRARFQIEGFTVIGGNHNRHRKGIAQRYFEKVSEDQREDDGPACQWL